MKIAMIAALAVLSSTLGACGSGAPGLDQGSADPESTNVDHVKQAVTFPWSSWYYWGYNFGTNTQSSANTGFTPTTGVCVINNVAGPLANGSYVSIPYDPALGYNKFIVHNGAYGAGGHGPSGGGLCAPLSAFTFAGSAPNQLFLINHGQLNSTYNGSTGAFTAADFSIGPGYGTNIIQTFGGWYGSSTSTQGVSFVEDPASTSTTPFSGSYGANYLTIGVNTSDNCITSPAKCGQVSYYAQYKHDSATDSSLYDFKKYVSDSYIYSASASTETTYNTSLHGEDGFCYITALGNNFADGTTQARAWVDPTTDLWRFGVIGLHTAASFSCIAFAQP